LHESSRTPDDPAQALPVQRPLRQIIDFGDLVVGDAGEDISEPGVGIDGVQFGYFDQGVGEGRSFAGLDTTCPILSLGYPLARQVACLSSHTEKSLFFCSPWTRYSY
jgi:hypothetical protein